MDSSAEETKHRFDDGVPDSFWDELEDMINDLDLAFDEELIDLKKNEVQSIGSTSAAESAFQECQRESQHERRLSNMSETVSTAPIGSLGQAILENIKKSSSLPINPKQYQTEANLEQVSSGELSKDSDNASESEYLPGIGTLNNNKKKKKKDKHKKKHKKVSSLAQQFLTECGSRFSLIF